MASNTKTWQAITLAFMVSLQPFSAHAFDDGEGYAPYVMLEDAMDATEATVARALREDKLALVILGANWCHDSKALARRLEDPELEAVLDEHYETLVVGVGYYEQGFDVAQQLGIAIYTHTPTVLIVDPKTRALVNLDDHDIWRDAARLSAVETLAYFEEKVEPKGWSPASSNGELAPDHAGLQAFESQQAERLRRAYAILGPKLKMESDDLDDFWRPVRDLRYQFADDLNRLRQEARDAHARGETFNPDWPTYEAFPWEVDEMEQSGD